MNCPKCGSDMDREKVTVDYYDPGQIDGHGEYETFTYLCPQCSYELEEETF